MPCTGRPLRIRGVEAAIGGLRLKLLRTFVNQHVWLVVPACIDCPRALFVQWQRDSSAVFLSMRSRSDPERGEVLRVFASRLAYAARTAQAQLDAYADEDHSLFSILQASDRLLVMLQAQLLPVTTSPAAPMSCLAGARREVRRGAELLAVLASRAPAVTPSTPTASSSPLTPPRRSPPARRTAPSVTFGPTHTVREFSPDGMLKKKVRKRFEGSLSTASAGLLDAAALTPKISHMLHSASSASTASSPAVASSTASTSTSTLLWPGRAKARRVRAQRCCRRPWSGSSDGGGAPSCPSDAGTSSHDGASSLHAGPEVLDLLRCSIQAQAQLGERFATTKVDQQQIANKLSGLEGRFRNLQKGIEDLVLLCGNLGSRWPSPPPRRPGPCSSRSTPPPRRRMGLGTTGSSSSTSLSTAGSIQSATTSPPSGSAGPPHLELPSDDGSSDPGWLCGFCGSRNWVTRAWCRCCGHPRRRHHAHGDRGAAVGEAGHARDSSDEAFVPVDAMLAANLARKGPRACRRRCVPGQPGVLLRPGLAVAAERSSCSDGAEAHVKDQCAGCSPEGRLLALPGSSSSTRRVLRDCGAGSGWEPALATDRLDDLQRLVNTSSELVFAIDDEAAAVEVSELVGVQCSQLPPDGRGAHARGHGEPELLGYSHGFHAAVLRESQGAQVLFDWAAPSAVLPAARRSRRRFD